MRPRRRDTPIQFVCCLDLIRFYRRSSGDPNDGDPDPTFRCRCCDLSLAAERDAEQFDDQFEATVARRVQSTALVWYCVSPPSEKKCPVTRCAGSGAKEEKGGRERR